MERPVNLLNTFHSPGSKIYANPIIVFDVICLLFVTRTTSLRKPPLGHSNDCLLRFGCGTCSGHAQKPSSAECQTPRVRTQPSNYILLVKKVGEEKADATLAKVASVAYISFPSTFLSLGLAP